MAEDLDLLWFDSQQTTALANIAKTGQGEPMKFMKAHAPDVRTKYYSFTKPLALIVVNTTPDDLNVIECKDIHGNLEYQAHDTSTNTSRISAAPVNVMGKGSSTVGVWLFGTGWFTDTPTGVVKMGPIPSLGNRPCYVGGAVLDLLQYTCSIGNFEHGSCQDYYDQFMDDGCSDHQVDTNASAGCYCSACGSEDGAINQIVVTAVVA